MVSRFGLALQWCKAIYLHFGVWSPPFSIKHQIDPLFPRVHHRSVLQFVQKSLPLCVHLRIVPIVGGGGGGGGVSN